MAIGTPTTLGSTTNGGAGSVTHSTTATAPSNSLILAVVSGVTNGSTPGITTFSGGGLTWAKDKEIRQSASSFGWTIAVWSAPAAGGLASASSLSLTWDQSMFDGIVTAAYCTGLDLTGSRLDNTDGRGRTTTTTSWDTQATTAPTTSVADTLLYGGAHCDHDTSSTPSGCTELFDFQEAANTQTLTVCYSVLSATGSVRLQGTFGIAGDLADVTAVAAYKATAGAPAVMPDVIMAPPIPG